MSAYVVIANGSVMSFHLSRDDALMDVVYYNRRYRPAYAILERFWLVDRRLDKSQK